ncbi:alpha/beta fold hydrolase [Nocardiopsis listeri]|uniref:alpha/beta fold hydrolase n=1 Tax=Nocardiopsis listeri TaxID=53440 RepID=UPI00083084DD|nr:alpha/beta hydrolase [Nocardiopsis listeri]
MTANLVGDVTISYTDFPPQVPSDSVPVLLLHGFGSSFDMNWRATGWLRTLETEGRRVIGPDLRGHGGSDKPTDSGLYLPEHFVADLLRLLDELGLPSVDVVGYSMGSRLAWALALTAPERVRRVVLGGFGPVDAPACLGADEPGAGDTPFDHVFRAVGGLPGNDPEALAACARGQAADPFTVEPRPEGVPILLVAGAKDTVAEGATDLAASCEGVFVEIPGRDHANAVSSRVFKQAAVDFLAG